MQWIPNRIRRLLGMEVKLAGATNARHLPMSGSGGGSGLFGNISWGRAQDADYRKAVPDITQNSAVAQCIGWIAANWPQAMPEVRRKGSDERWEAEAHPLADLLLKPSPYYSSRDLWKGIIRDFFGGAKPGNAFAYIVCGSNGNGTPLALQFLPAGTIKAVGQGEQLISHYEYRPVGAREVIILPRERVLHFRNGIDPNNPKYGIDPLSAALPEIATDCVATRSQFDLLERGGVPPWVIGPDGKDTDGVIATIEPDDADKLKQKAVEAINRREGLVMYGPFKLEKLGFDPKNLVVGETQRKSEERIAGQFHLPPIVAGLGAGLDRSTYNNSEEARQAAWEDCIIPMQDDFGDELNAKLLPLYGETSADVRLFWNRSEVRCLQDDENAKATNASTLYGAGVVDRAAAKRRAGEVPEDADKDVYAISGSKGGLTTGAKPQDPAQKGYPLPFDAAPLLGPEVKNVGLSASDDDALNQALDDFRRRLQGREDSAVRLMQDALDVAEASIRQAQDALQARIEQAEADGEKVNEAWLIRQERFNALLRQVEAAYADLTSLAKPLEAIQAGYVADGQAMAEVLARAALGSIPEGVTAPAWNVLPTRTIEALVGFASDGSPLAKVLAEVSPTATNAVRDALIGGVALGKNPRETARAMRQAADAQVNLTRARSEAFARTETLRAAREAGRQSFLENADVVSGQIWTATLDARTCRGCWAMHGTVLPLTARINDHVNGRCVGVPQVKSWSEITGDADLVDTRPVIATGAEVFAGLDPVRQRSILGGQLFDLYQGGNLQLTDCVTEEQDARWGSQRRAATIEEATANAAGRAGN